MAAGPVLGNSFLVDIGDGDGPEGFAQVVFPEFMAVGTTGPLILRRPATGSLRLYRWWAAAHQAAQRRQALPDNEPKPAVNRDVRITLLSSEAVPVLNWRLLAAQPISLGYSPLDAAASAIVMETIALDFHRLEIE